MTRDKIIEDIVEGYVKDVLTYDLSKHHPRPHERFRFNNAARKAKEKAREVFRNKAKSAHDTQPIDVSKFVSKSTARRAPGIKVPKSYRPKLKMSSARRKGPTVRQQQGRKAVLGAAAAIGAGMVAHKAYKYHKAKKKREMREGLIEALSTHKVYKARMFSKKPQSYAKTMTYWQTPEQKSLKAVKKKIPVVSLELRSKKDKSTHQVSLAPDPRKRLWGKLAKMQGFDPKSKKATLKRRAFYRLRKNKYKVVEGDLGDFAVAPTAAVDASPIHKEQRDRYWMIKNRKKIKNMIVKEVFDDTYGSSVLDRAARVEKSTNFIAKAKKLKSLVGKARKLTKDYELGMYHGAGKMSKMNISLGNKKFGKIG